jgi:peptidoglycan/xylan/chitin deacetylase (PgdA/CDA1 family)
MRRYTTRANPGSEGSSGGDGGDFVEIPAATRPNKGSLVVKERIRSVLATVDGWISRNSVDLFGERNALSIVLFHHLLLDEKENALNVVHPQERTTVDHFRRFVTYYLGQGYRFVSPDDVCDGLPPDEKYMMITFDDGYFSNFRLLPLLKEFTIPAVFFISSGHVQENRAFWWDVLYRMRKAEGASDVEIAQEEQGLTFRTHTEIESYLQENFGSSALAPVGELDRPFTPSELRDFAGDPNVHIGNHTCHHARLTSYSLEEAASEILGSQRALHDMTGRTPISIAYPAGAYSPEIVALARRAGLMLGITTVQRKNPLPLVQNGDSLLQLHRYTLSGITNIEKQCERFRSDFQFMTALETTKRSLKL